MVNTCIPFVKTPWAVSRNSRNMVLRNQYGIEQLTWNQVVSIFNKYSMRTKFLFTMSSPYRTLKTVPRRMIQSSAIVWSHKRKDNAHYHWVPHKHFHCCISWVYSCQMFTQVLPWQLSMWYYYTKLCKKDTGRLISKYHFAIVITFYSILKCCISFPVNQITKSSLFFILSVYPIKSLQAGYWVLPSSTFSMQ